jgi:hypothetical protein
MKLRNLFARPKLIRTFEELQNSKEPIIAYREKPGHREGAGSLFQDIISAQILCNLAGKFLACPRIRYLHHHKSAGDTLEAYLQKKFVGQNLLLNTEFKRKVYREMFF